MPIGPRFLTVDVIDLANHIRASKDWSRLPLLADALEDAGCTYHCWVAHLRCRGVHEDNDERCRVVEQILGRPVFLLPLSEPH